MIVNNLIIYNNNISNNMFKWDGTDVTNIISCSNVYEAKYGKYKYWVITHEQKTEICIVRNSKNTLACLIDELKPVFELYKIGTHWYKQGAKIKILLKCSKTEDGTIKEELTLKDIKQYDDAFKSKIQNIFAFRELLGITCSYSSSIIVRNSMVPVSFYEPNMLTEDKKIIPFTIIEKWFANSSIDEVVQRLCKINTLNGLVTVLHTLRTKIEDVIVRTDSRNIGYKDCIMNRITERLQTSLK